ncbi:mechanosensitive ion channel family protein [Puniceicoccaceae bacterium K14]|nr:mechanosensitive ion channel family protein [Puniceicoccaceae bacterium K14]
MRLLSRFFAVALMYLAILPIYAQEIDEAKEAAPNSAEFEEVGSDFSKIKEDTIGRVADFIDIDMGDNSSSRLVLSFAILLGAYIARKIVSLLFSNWLHRIAKKTAWEFDDHMVPAIGVPLGWLVFLFGLFLSLSVLSFSEGVDVFVLRMFQASSMVVVFWGVLRVVDVLAEAMLDVTRNRDMGVYHFIPLIKKVTRAFLIVIAVLMVAQNLGYSISSLLAGLGIGGLAVALAAQESLGNFFGSVSIVADRPFKVGDWIQIGNKVDGDVEEIGLRSTKVRTWSKTVMTIPNKVMANEIIENWSRMPKRRVKQYIGVTYSTSPENMEGLVEDLRQMLRDDEGVNQDFILVNFTDFGESALQILVYYFTKTTKWLEHMDVRQRVNIKIMKLVEARGSSIAFPTNTVHFDGQIAENIASGLSSKS